MRLARIKRINNRFPLNGLYNRTSDLTGALFQFLGYRRILVDNES